MSVNYLEILAQEKYNDYLAHLRDDGQESLYEHTKLVSDYGNCLSEANGLITVIESLCSELFSGIEHNKLICNFAIKLFFDTLIYHDLGKVNPNFQYAKMNQIRFEKIKVEFGSDHSKIGAFVYLIQHLQSANQLSLKGVDKLCCVHLVLSFSYIVYNHHNSEIITVDLDNYSTKFIKDVFQLLELLDAATISPEMLRQVLVLFGKSKEEDRRLNNSTFPLFALLKLNYSLLTASDYLATTHYMNRRSEMFNDFGLLNLEQKRRIVKRIEESKNYNQLAYVTCDDFVFDFPNEANNGNLNYLRKALSVEIINGVRSNTEENLFYIEAPTGGGKTNLSMLVLAELFRSDLEKNTNQIKKVFYVFPYTTLITQTYDTLKETLGLQNDEILQLHSKSGFEGKELYGDKRENIIDYQFLNFPFALISHIRFFDILKSNRKSTNYPLHRIANSVVVIDELQTYSPKEWDKVIYFIEHYAKHFNIKFILMSATLPKIDKLRIESIANDEFVYLNKYRDEYFSNKNFCERVKFDFSLLHSNPFRSKEKSENLESLWEIVAEKSSDYFESNKRVHCIIEFIFKNSAGTFLQVAKEQNELFDEIFLLSGAILESRRNEIISKLKSDEFVNKNILLITTQVVEAGVDIDMDIGFKDSSILDSDEQLAGRINRNVKKPQCTLYLFNLDDASVIYGKDPRFELIQQKLADEYEEILQNKNFDLLYDAVIEYRKKINEQIGWINLKSYIQQVKQLDFKAIDTNFKLIENRLQTESLFLALNIPVKSTGSCIQNFNKNELDFLKQFDKYFDDDEYVSGEQVWELYLELIHSEHFDFTEKKLNKIMMQGIMSKFTLNVSVYSKPFKDALMIGVLEESYGFYYVAEPNEIYDYEEGFKEGVADSAIIF